MNRHPPHPGDQAMNKPTEKQIEAAARAIIAAKAPTVANDDHWPDTVKHYREMCAKWPEYKAANSLITDSFREAEIALSAALAVEAGTGARVDIEDILHSLDEAIGFAAMSPRGRDNIRFALDELPDRLEQAWRAGFVDGEKHAAECADIEARRYALTTSPASSACAARKQGTAGGNDPADCDWPFCGCDPHADKVIAALQECGWSSPASSAVEGEAVYWVAETRMGLVPAAPYQPHAIPLYRHPAPTPAGDTDLTRPIIGIENRTAQEVFDIMVDRIRFASPAPQTEDR